MLNFKEYFYLNENNLCTDIIKELNWKISNIDGITSNIDSLSNRIIKASNNCESLHDILDCLSFLQSKISSHTLSHIKFSGDKTSVKLELDEVIFELKILISMACFK